MIIFSMYNLENDKFLSLSTGVLFWGVHFYTTIVSSDSLCPPTKPTPTQSQCCRTTYTACLLGAPQSPKW